MNNAPFSARLFYIAKITLRCDRHHITACWCFLHNAHSPRRELFAGARLDFPGIVDKMEGVWEPIRESGILIQNAGVDASRGLGTLVDSAVKAVLAFAVGGRALPWQDPRSALPAGVSAPAAGFRAAAQPAPGAQAERKITE